MGREWAVRKSERGPLVKGREIPERGWHRVTEEVAQLAFRAGLCVSFRLPIVAVESRRLTEIAGEGRGAERVALGWWTLIDRRGRVWASDDMRCLL